MPILKHESEILIVLYKKISALKEEKEKMLETLSYLFGPGGTPFPVDLKNGTTAYTNRRIDRCLFQYPQSPENEDDDEAWVQYEADREAYYNKIQESLSTFNSQEELTGFFKRVHVFCSEYLMHDLDEDMIVEQFNTYFKDVEQQTPPSRNSR